MSNYRLPKENSAIGILLLRIFIGARLFYGVIDNVISWEHMKAFAQFLELNHFPFPTVNAIISVYVQFIGSILILVGIKTRIAAAILVINFIVALLGFHIPANDSIELMTPALAMLFGCLTLFFTGAKRYSLDNYFKQ